MTLQQLFDPSGVDVVGASDTEGKIGYEAMANAAAFDGPVYPVNPSTEGELFGREFVSSVTEIDGDVDLALCCVPGPAVPDVLEECGEAGIGAAVIYASEGIEEDLADDRARLEDAGIPYFETPERAADAAGVLARYANLHADDAVADGGRVEAAVPVADGG